SWPRPCRASGTSTGRAADPEARAPQPDRATSAWPRSSTPGARTEDGRRRSGQRGRGLGEGALRGRPVDARVGDRYPVAEPGAPAGELLVPGLEVALQHEAHDGAVAGPDLRHQVVQHARL